MNNELNNLYQQVILDHNKRPRNRHPMSAPDRCAEGHNPLCGDHLTLYLQIRDGLVEDISFEGRGCAISTASASLMTETLKGKTLAEAKALFKKFHQLITGGSVETSDGPNLGKLEVFSGVCRYPARVKCATLAWHTLDSALENKNEPVSTE